MLRALVSGEDPPDWVEVAAREAGIELLPFGAGESFASVTGYVMNSFGNHEPEAVTAGVLARMPDLQVVVYLG